MNRDLPRTAALLSISALAITITVALLIAGWRTWRAEVRDEHQQEMARQEQALQRAYQAKVDDFESDCWAKSDQVGDEGMMVRGTWYEYALPTFWGDTHTCEWARPKRPAYFGYDHYCSEEHPGIAACFIMPSREIPEP